MEFITNNAANIFVVAIITALAVLALRHIVRDRKSGRCACGGNCKNCHATFNCQSKQ